MLTCLHLTAGPLGTVMTLDLVRFHSSKIRQNKMKLYFSTMRKSTLFISLLALACTKQVNNEVPEVSADNQSDSQSVKEVYSDSLHGHGFDFDNNGKRNAPLFENTFVKAEGMLQLELMRPEALQTAIDRTIPYLKRKSSKMYAIGNLKVTGEEFLQAIALVNRGQWDKIQPYQIAGEDSRGNVHMTAYFTPEVEVRDEMDTLYKYPFYRYPGTIDPMPTREEIDVYGSLTGKDLEICYAKDFFDVYTMHVQGSGMVRFDDGRTMKLGYAGQNGQKYRSIGRILVEAGELSPDNLSLENIKGWLLDHPDTAMTVLAQNPSYIFFEPQDAGIYGAAGIELVPDVSIAADKRFLPFGSVVMAEVPMLNDQGRLIGHEYKIQIVHDRGGAIKGAGHIDRYMGIGPEAHKKAQAMHHYGRVWLLLPKVE